ncbi:MAG TPA: RNA polymerase sigma factor [Acidobacteriaceae bacterium]|nr:RNA polymerase sigma factor [Acidobacteriaceae bacterium]
MERTPGIVSLVFGNAQTGALDESSFRPLYEATAQPLRAYLLHVCRRPDVADDLLQETYCRYLMHRRTDMDEQQTRSYLFRIATNLLHDRVRSRVDLAVPEIPEGGATPRLETRLDVRATLLRLKPRERELLWLAYVEGMSHEEIAAATGLRPLSIKILLFRARRKAAQLLAPPKAQKRFA